MSVYGLLTLFRKPSHTAHNDEQHWGYDVLTTSQERRGFSGLLDPGMQGIFQTLTPGEDCLSSRDYLQGSLAGNKGINIDFTLTAGQSWREQQTASPVRCQEGTTRLRIMRRWRSSSAQAGGGVVPAEGSSAL